MNKENRILYRFNTLCGNAGDVFFRGTAKECKKEYERIDLGQRRNFILEIEGK